MGLFDIFKPKKYSEKWIRSLSDKDFYAEREPVRKALCNGSEKAYDILDRFDEYFTPIVPGRIAYPSRLYFPVDPPVRWISSAQRLAFARYSRMFTLPVSIQIALCTMRSMIASA